MGSFLPVSALDTFFIFLVPFFSLLLSPFIVIFSASVFFVFLLSPLWYRAVVSLPHDRTEKREWGHGGNGRFLFLLAHCLHTSHSLFSRACIWEAYLHMLSWGRQNDETVQWREKNILGEAERGKRETSRGSTACGKSPGLPDPTGTFWTLDTILLFPSSSKRKTDVLSLCSPT